MKTAMSFILMSLLGVSVLATAKTIEMDVNGLVCAFCAQGIDKTLKAMPATQAVYVSLEHRLVAIELKDGADIDDADLRSALTDAGYSVVGIRRSDATLDAIRQRVAADAAR